MRVDRVSFWSRINAWLRGNDRADGHTSSPSFHDASGSVSPTIKQANAPYGLAAPGTTYGSGRGVDEPRPEKASTESRLTQLVESIQENLRAQVQGSDVLVGSLDRLAEGLERLPEFAKAEAGVLEKVAADVSAGAGGVKRLEAVLSQWPQIVDSQREAFVMLTRELERTRQSHEKVVTALDTLQQSVTRSISTSEQASTALRDLRTEGTRREEKLERLAGELSQRLYWCAGVGVGVAALAIILALVALFRS